MFQFFQVLSLTCFWLTAFGSWDWFVLLRCSISNFVMPNSKGVKLVRPVGLIPLTL